MKNILKKICLSISVGLFLFLSFGCDKSTIPNKKSIAVFVPGIVADSPIYANLVKGVQDAVAQYNSEQSENKKVSVTIFEAGTNQAEWGAKLTSLASTGKYNVIISSNPSLPELCAPLIEQFPLVKFILLDASINGNQNIAAISYNQKEQSYLTGFIAGLMSKSHKVGFIAAQEYPIMNNVLLPYYSLGAKTADENTSVDFRIVGNWYDASKGAELTDAMCAAGVDVILPICGGASQGVISSAKEHKIYLTWFDENGFSKAPGTVISSCLVKQEVAAKEVTLDYLNDKTEWGTTKIVGFADGYISFIEDDPLYLQYVPENVRAQLSVLVAGLKNGSVVVPEAE